MTERNRDTELLALDFIGECGEFLASFGAAICAAAAAENREVLELALRHARSTLLEAIAEFKALGQQGGGK
ncbi:hypothetical protein OGR47_05075 [Methylocystis sp. MJC1]|jgi:hypothetical protein|uniref:hypothetical protein n=1 Tax=Methylocystis sp. MJC1 TaxID=2654282 RepID=UPI0013ED9C44|nr:hypothetical protein [Methylocystis sp. MJC1]KAF2989729.1 hypothetical protein MJC1_03074 [Methylocystis sp. MJC1]MBU6526382.1 hypothetical protein [Methylocystis sp. MJC1]UZX12829.1 hypothetical protein OGR47_05075 [Methylocystis sp. MJC1]